MLINETIYPKWNWDTLHRKVVQVIHAGPNPSTLEPKWLSFVDVTENKIYITDNFDKDLGNEDI